MRGTFSTDPPSTAAARPTLWGEPLRSWLLLAVGVCAVSAQSASSLAFAVLMKPMTQTLNIDRTTFASAMSLRMLLMVLAMSVAGIATDRFGARAVLASGALIVGACTVALAWVPSAAWLYPIMALIGPGQAAIGSVAASALIVRHFSRRRGWAVGILNGGDNLLNASIPILTAAVLQQRGWQAALVALGGAYLALALLVRATMRRGDGRSAAPTPHTAPTPAALRVQWRSFWLVIVVYMGVYAFVTSVQLHLHAYLTDLGSSPSQASQVLSTQLLVGALGAPLIGGIAGRWGARPALLATVVGLFIASLLLWNVHHGTALLAWAVFYGLVNSGIVALLALVLTEIFGAARIGERFGLAMMFCMGSTMVANVYSAAMFDHFGSYRLVWQSYTALMAALLVPVLWLAREPRSHPPG
ncbi:MAG: putative MFS-type transporter YbfB [Candidatus Binatia bacterium]|nr:MAG: putative MFS-type transporter YbfB [Fimbriimonadales bacterium]GIW44205.1 MAG: putative MFS-type transporter YbfB [Candidatus Binatia bacterium]